MRRSQLFLPSVFFLALVFLFSYYIEVNNFYIQKNSNLYIMENIENEVCNIFKTSNFSFIDDDLENSKIQIRNLCSSYDFICILDFDRVPNTNLETVMENYSVEVSMDDRYQNRFESNYEVIC